MILCFSYRTILALGLMSIGLTNNTVAQNVVSRSPETTPQCLYRMGIEYGGVFSQRGDNFNRLNSAGSSVKCLQQEIQKAITACNNWVNTFNGPQAAYGSGWITSHWDDCIVQGYFLQDEVMSTVGNVNGYDAHGYPRGTMTPASRSHCYKDPYDPVGVVKYCREGVFYFDSECNSLPGLQMAAGEKACLGCVPHRARAATGHVVCRSCDTTHPLETGETVCSRCTDVGDSGEDHKSFQKGGFTCNFCQDVAAPPGQEICDAGNLFFRLSPISFIWEGDNDAEESTPLVKFPLDPARPEKWYIWRASAKRPLLVYDPKHRGVITSGSQLFGNWTFGGKQDGGLTQLSLSTQERQMRTSWTDGYEALSSLDKNGDNKLSDAELQPLALWFDSNQNAISEPGEVKSLTSLGIFEVYYAETKKDFKTGDVHAVLGYRRNSGEKVITGASVDWYAEEGDSKWDLAGKLLVQGALSSVEESLSIESAASSDFILPSDSIDVGGALVADTISGVWQWKTEDEQFKAQGEFKPHGFLTFSEQGGKLKGHSLVEAPFSRSIANAKSMLKIFSLEGQRQATADTGLVFTFTAKTDEGTTITSKAYLSDDGKKLQGESEIVIKSGESKQKFSYNWIANRIAA